jgi:hypothetical protein
LLESVEQFFNHITDVFVLFDSHLLLFSQSRLHGEEPCIVDSHWLDEHARPVIVLVLDDIHSNLLFFEIGLVLLEVLAADLLDVLDTEEELVVGIRGGVLHLFNAFVHEIVHFVELAGELVYKFFVFRLYVVGGEGFDFSDVRGEGLVQVVEVVAIVSDLLLKVFLDSHDRVEDLPTEVLHTFLEFVVLSFHSIDLFVRGIKGGS